MPAALRLDALPRMYRPQPPGERSEFPGDDRNRLVLTAVRGPSLPERRAYHFARLERVNGSPVEAGDCGFIVPRRGRRF